MTNFLPFKFLLSLFLLVWTATSSSVSGDRNTYIIHMDKSAMPAPFSTHHDWYISTLSSLSSVPNGVAPTHLYTYTHVKDGFSAVLSQAHLDQIRNIPGHLAAYPDTIGHLHTTHTPKFLGLKKRVGIWPTAGFGNDIIIGVIDTGIWPETGNSGPDAYSIHNGAPWITTIGAGTVDRDYAAHITLGDNELILTGRSVYPENLFVSEVPIYFGLGNQSKEQCDPFSLDPKDVAGKYVFCTRQSSEIFRIGAAGGIFSSETGQFLEPTDFNMPFVIINPTDGELVKNYIINAKNANVSIKFQITVLGTKPAPQVAYFSSRGPAGQSPYILKPDILAPGLDILASWIPNRGVQPIRDQYLLSNYAIISGTSMSCPHVAGIAALLKAVHLDWSSAAIRSAMMTTANIYDNANGIIVDMDNGVAGTPLDFGAGHVNPNKAMDPGLVYDIEVEDYIYYLCGLNYTSNQIRVLTGTSNFTCEQANLDLNYPSFIVILNNTNTTSINFKRVLTNVADGSSVYRSMVTAPKGMEVVVQPATISFAGKYSKAEFNMTVSISLGTNAIPQDDYIGNFGFLSWYEVNGKHIVRSPIVSAFAP
ncbi:hypothetical protein Q3G72_018937 [Acer saccharum]|nr:hypothetical protein Q3G72_018937 [Acer saccharum]